MLGLLPLNNKNTFPLQTDSSSSSSKSSDRYLQAHLHAVSKLYTVSRKAVWASIQLILDLFYTNPLKFLFPCRKNRFSNKQSSTNQSWESVSSCPRRLENCTKIRMSKVKHSSLHLHTSSVTRQRLSSASCLYLKRML